ncbi:hypothetical protein A4E84_01675 [Streptomyces qaidamensis]|uniref:Uncharacterized protein n=1 Tax=Streptomyces qaidamensis TaxID=1783515 RepID=A0A143BT87_9ACTN|nr:hypothetical protein A4E84_01675 [Streptomyces qaidamensis]
MLRSTLRRLRIPGTTVETAGALRTKRSAVSATSSGPMRTETPKSRIELIAFGRAARLFDRKNFHLGGSSYGVEVIGNLPISSARQLFHPPLCLEAP